LSFPTGLALRLQRSSIIAWTVGLFVLGSSYGSILGDLEGFIESSDLIKQMIPDTGDGLNMTERFVSLLMTILSIMGSVPVLLFVLKLRSEEKKNRTEHILTRAVSRNSLLGGYTVIALIAAPVIQLASLSGLWSSAVMVMEDPVSFQTLLTAGMVALPAMWCMVALAVLLIGVAPNRTGLTWLYLGYTFFVVYMGDMLKLPDWTNKLTPFGYIPQIPTEEINVFTLIILTMIAILLMVMGFMAYNKRRERYITMAHKLGVSGSTIFSDSKLFSELFWEGIEHIEIGEFSDEDAVNTFLKIYKEKQVGFGIHSPVIRGESKYDLIEKVRYDPSYAWEQLESEAKRMSLEGAKYILVHFPFFKAEVSGNTDEMIEEGLKKICRIQKKYSIPIICEPKLGFQRSVAGLNYFD
ncbi:MAG TPA: hypothetical protein DDZ89_21475, partial [Clostridiales bacterium]|nr:hypothetical protein [Clostridiales bacterium]